MPRLFILLIPIVGLCACGSTKANTPQPIKSLDTTAAPTTQSIAPVVQKTLDEKEIATRAQLTDEQKEACTKGESFGLLRLDMTTKELVERYSAPLKKRPRQLYEANGDHVEEWIWEKQGLLVSMFANNMTDPVTGTYFLEVTAPFGEKTKKGISIGSTRQEVLAAYDTCLDQSSLSQEQIIVGSPFGDAMVFVTKESKVIKMMMGTLAE